jgi:hypothetical protein
MTSSDARSSGQPERQAAAVVTQFSSSGSQMSQNERGRLLASLADALKTSAQHAGSTTMLSGQWFTDQLVAIIPRIPIRDQATLRRQHPGMSPEQLADELISSAATASMAVGAAVGVAAVIPIVPSMPLQLAAETLVVAALEIKLIAELHEVYGLRPAGGMSERTVAYLHSWSTSRGARLLSPMSLSRALRGPLKRRLERRLVGRAGRNVTALVPFFGGAMLAGFLNRRETRKLAEAVRNDLRAHSGIVAHWPY